MRIRRMTIRLPARLRGTAEQEARHIAQAVTEQFQGEISAKDGEIATLKADKEKLTADAGELNTRVAQLEKSDVIRSEEALDAKADAIWKEKLSQCGIPERLHGKVAVGVSREKFMGDDGFDVNAFTEAVETEISDWEEKLGEPVQGLGFSRKSAVGEDNQFTEDDADALADQMAASLGNKAE